MTTLTSSLDAFEHSVAAKRHLAPVLLRLGLGVVFLAHSYAKLAVFTLPGTMAYFEAHGLPGLAVYPVLALELAGGLALLLGFHVRLAAAALLPVMLGALVPHVANGWMFTNSGGGWEYVAFLLVALAAQVLLGGGSLGRSSASAPVHHSR